MSGGALGGAVGDGGRPGASDASIRSPASSGVTAALVLRAIVALLVAAFLLAYVRATVESRRAFALGEEAETLSDWQSAVFHDRHSVQWYAPRLGRSGAAFDRLVEIGDNRVEADDVEGALVAYRSARHGVMSIRHLATPFAERLPALHRTIGALMAEQVA